MREVVCHFAEKKGEGKAKMMVAGWRILCYNKIACLYASSIADKGDGSMEQKKAGSICQAREGALLFAILFVFCASAFITGHYILGTGEAVVGIFLPDGSLLSSGGPAAPAPECCSEYIQSEPETLEGTTKGDRTPACPDGAQPGGRQHRLGKLSTLGNFRRPEKCRR